MFADSLTESRCEAAQPSIHVETQKSCKVDAAGIVWGQGSFAAGLQCADDWRTRMASLSTVL